MVPDLVALAIPAGPAYVDALQRIWDTGAAVLPVDLRLPEAAQQRLVESLGANRVVDATGEHTLAAGRPTEAGDALVVATSGTTGTPKGVVITHDALDAAAFATSKGVDADPAADGWLCCLPVAHMGGLGVITRAVRTGTPLVVHDGFDAEAVEAAARAGSTLVSLVPTAMRRIDTSLFRTILVGGSAIPPDRPANSMATYGLTETCGGVIYERQALEGVEVREGAETSQVSEMYEQFGWDHATTDSSAMRSDGQMRFVMRTVIPAQPIQDDLDRKRLSFRKGEMVQLSAAEVAELLE